jgi:hypothetical protein
VTPASALGKAQIPQSSAVKWQFVSEEDIGDKSLVKSLGIAQQQG